MAKAKKFTPKEPQHAVRLLLTEEEARTLHTILRAVAGGQAETRRGDADKIRHALEGVGVDGSGLDREHTGSIRFRTPDEMASRL